MNSTSMLTLIATITMLIIVIIKHPPLGIIVILVIVVHELGHAIVAKYYGVFEKFTLVNTGFGVVHRRPNSYSKNVRISIAGFLFSLIPIFVGGYFFLTVQDVCVILFGSIFGSIYDFKNIIRYRKIYKKSEGK
jgi:Zn-dependent protease